MYLYNDLEGQVQCRILRLLRVPYLKMMGRTGPQAKGFPTPLSTPSALLLFPCLTPSPTARNSVQVDGHQGLHIQASVPSLPPALSWPPLGHGVYSLAVLFALGRTHWERGLCRLWKQAWVTWSGNSRAQQHGLEEAVQASLGCMGSRAGAPLAGVLGQHRRLGSVVEQMPHLTTTAPTQCQP